VNRFVFAIVLVGLLGLSAAVQASTVTLTDVTSGNFATNAPGGGGAFMATTSADSLLGVVDPFITFCLEFNEHFNYNTTYNFTLSNGAVNGGVAGGNPDVLSPATKWLYYQARTGGYASLVTSLGGAVTSSGSYIQEAIWFLEEEKASGAIDPVSYLLALHANTQLAAWATLEANGNRVYAMNLTTIPGGDVVQDQLALSVPESGSTLVLASLGLIMLGAVGARVRRREHDILLAGVR